MDYYSAYRRLDLFLNKSGVLRITITNPGRANAIDQQTHLELSRIWVDADEDPRVRAIVITGDGKHFCAGGDLEWVKQLATDFQARVQGFHEARDLVRNMVDCSKPIVSAVRGVAVGAGLALAVLADISVVSDDAKLIDGHTKIGVAAGDHAVLIWPLLCGPAKAKYYLLTGEPLTGAEAERIGLVSLSVDDSEVLAQAEQIAIRLAQGSALAIRWTKHALNAWLHSFTPHFDTSLALEFLSFGGPDATEGIDATQQRRPAAFLATPGTEQPSNSL